MRLNVLAIGDSIIEAEEDPMQGWTKRFAQGYAEKIGLDLNYHNKGQGGAKSSDVLQNLGPALSLEYSWSMIIVGVGVNDSRRTSELKDGCEVSAKQFKFNLNEICNRLINSSNADIVIFSSILPVVQQKTYPLKRDKYYTFEDTIHYASILENIMRKYPSINYFNFKDSWLKLPRMTKSKLMPDGLHPNSDGHEYLANLALQQIKRIKTLR